MPYGRVVGVRGALDFQKQENVGDASPEEKHGAQRLAVAVARASGLTDSDSDFAGCPAA